eukprot:9500924-Pyramimonas_sp.AAC.3
MERHPFGLPGERRSAILFVSSSPFRALSCVLQNSRGKSGAARLGGPLAVTETLRRSSSPTQVCSKYDSKWCSPGGNSPRRSSKAPGIDPGGRNESVPRQRALILKA